MRINNDYWAQDGNKGDARFQRLCPLLWNAIYGRRYVLPNYRCVDYQNQDTLNTVFERALIANALGVLMKDTDVQFDNLIGALCWGRPVLFLERELGEAFLREQLPSDLHVTDVHWKWPQTRIMLPLGLCTIRRNGMSRSLAYLDICLLDKEIRAPEKCEAELENYLQRVPPAVYADPRRRKINELCYHGKQSCLCLFVATDGHHPATYTWIARWTQDTLSQLVSNQDGMLQPERDETDEEFLRRVRHLMFSVLVFLSQMPFEYQPEVFRKERQKGDHIRPALLRARFVGASQVRPIRTRHLRRKDHQPSSQHRAAHWTSGYWTRMPCGPRRSERKLM